MEDLEKRFGYFLFSGIAEADSGMCSLLKRREICRRISIFLEKCTKEPFKRKKKSQIILHLFLRMRKDFIV